MYIKKLQIFLKTHLKLFSKWSKMYKFWPPLLVPIINLWKSRLEEKFNHSVVSNALVQILSLSESVESTRIEGTQVTFSDMIEEKNDKNPRWEIIEVRNYQKALEDGFERIRIGYPISSKLIKELLANHTFKR